MPTMNLPLSGEEKSKVNADNERYCKKEATTDTRANCTQNTPSVNNNKCEWSQSEPHS